MTAQLIDASRGSHLWSERYDREMTDVFAIQDEISRAIAEKLRVRLSTDRPFVRRHTENIEAYNLYLIGRYHFAKYSPEGLAKSKEYFEKAIRLDPHYALAWFGLAHWRHYQGGSGAIPPQEANAQCRQVTLKALELDEMLPQAHAMMGVIRANEYEWQDAELEFRRAQELGPETAETYGFYSGFYLIPMQRLDEAIEVLKRGLELKPLSSSMQMALGVVYGAIRKFDRAIDHLRKALELRVCQ